MNPLACFDIEGTGVDPARDRIVSIAINVYKTTAAADRLYHIVNPTIPIPKEAAAIHGFTDDKVKDKPTFSTVARQVHTVISGCDLVGFNLLNYDIPLLWEEFFRCGIEWDLSGVNVIDVGNIFKKKEERTLAAAVKFYCGTEHDGAHNAMADCDATLRVLQGQLGQYVDLQAMSRADLAKFSRFEDRVDLAGKIVLNADGVPCYNIGDKTRGVPVTQDPGFGSWMLNKDFTANTKIVLRRLLFPPKPQADDLPM